MSENATCLTPPRSAPRTGPADSNETIDRFMATYEDVYTAPGIQARSGRVLLILVPEAASVLAPQWNT